MSIATVVTMGFGSFGSVNNLPTLGYSIATAPVPSSEGMEFRLAGRLHALASGEAMHAMAIGGSLHGRAAGEPMHAITAGGRLHYTQGED